MKLPTFITEKVFSENDKGYTVASLLAKYNNPQALYPDALSDSAWTNNAASSIHSNSKTGSPKLSDTSVITYTYGYTTHEVGEIIFSGGEYKRIYYDESTSKYYINVFIHCSLS